MDFLLLGNELTFFLQLVVAMALGVVLGAERNIAGKTAGMRTYALVAMGACLFTIVGVTTAKLYSGIMNVDPLRVMAGIITGVGFIGAGLIIFRESSVRGLTTAAGLWVAAAVGVAVGFEMYVLATLATVLTLFVFTALWILETRVKFFSYDAGKTKIIDDVPEDDEPELR